MIAPGPIYALAGVAVFVGGAASLALEVDLLRKIVSFNVMGSGAFLVLVGAAQRDGAVDPVPHAMVLTGIVVTVAATALGLALARRLSSWTGAVGLPPRDDDA